jgi:hypothetical protein
MISYRQTLCFSFIFLSVTSLWESYSFTLIIKFVSLFIRTSEKGRISSFMTSVLTYLIPFLHPFHVFIPIPPLSVKTVN